MARLDIRVQAPSLTCPCEAPTPPPPVNLNYEIFIRDQGGNLRYRGSGTVLNGGFFDLRIRNMPGRGRVDVNFTGTCKDNTDDERPFIAANAQDYRCRD